MLTDEQLDRLVRDCQQAYEKGRSDGVAAERKRDVEVLRMRANLSSMHAFADILLDAANEIERGEDASHSDL